MGCRLSVSSALLYLPLAHALTAVAPTPVGTQAKANNPPSHCGKIEPVDPPGDLWSNREPI